MSEGRPLQATVLLDLIQDVDGSTWALKREGWNMETFVCNWEGIECDSLSFVTEINLEGTSLLATIPQSITTLTSLKRLILASNRIYGTIPEDLGSKLVNLEEIDLSENRLRGPIPDFSSKKLEVIVMSHNQLSGKFPAFFGVNLDNVNILDLKANRISGVIPPTIGQMVGLTELDLSGNNFSGPIPHEFGNLVKLEGLFLNNNELIGRIPTTLTRDYLPLKQIHLHKNFLSGTIPAALSNLEGLDILFIDENKFTGTVPKEVCEKNLNENFFSGLNMVKINDSLIDGNGTTTDKDQEEYINVDDLPDKNNVEGEIQERDGCTSVACPTGTRSARSATKDGVFPCIPCQVDHFNPYLGSSSCSEILPEEILLEFYKATDGVNWKMGGDSWKDTSVPVCDKHGVGCSHDGSIIFIQLSNMRLSGTIIESLGYLRTVEVLDFSDNNLFGNIPNALKFLPLEYFDISGNMLTGFVPPDLCEKYGVNGNGEDGEFLCSRIACPVGSFGSTGFSSSRENDDENMKCLPCGSSKAIFLASKTCDLTGETSITTNNKAFSTTMYEAHTGTVIGLFVVVLATISFLIYMLMRYSKDDHRLSSYSRGRRASSAGDSLEMEQVRFTSTTSADERSPGEEVWLDVAKIT